MIKTCILKKDAGFVHLFQQKLYISIEYECI